MAWVKLSPYPNGWGTKTEIDNVELPDVRDISLHFSVDGIATLTTEVIVTRPFTWEGNADVHIHLTVPDGFVLVEETDSTGRKKYWACHPDDVDEEE